MTPTARSAHRATTAKLRHLLTAPSFDGQAWAAAVAHDLHVRIGNAQPAIGKTAALGTLGVFFSRIDSLGDGFCEMRKVKETIYAEMEVGFTNAAGLEQQIPCAIVVRLTVGGSLLDIRVHLDPSPIP